MGAQADYTGEIFLHKLQIALLNDFVLVWGCVGPLWLRYAVRSAEHGVYARRSHCRWRCNWVGAPCQIEISPLSD